MGIYHSIAKTVTKSGLSTVCSRRLVEEVAGVLLLPFSFYSTTKLNSYKKYKKVFINLDNTQCCPVRFLRKHNLFSVFWDYFCLKFGSQSCRLHF